MVFIHGALLSTLLYLYGAYTWRLTVHITVHIWCLYMAPYCPHYCTYMVHIHGALLSTLLYLYGVYSWRLIVHIMGTYMVFIHGALLSTLLYLYGAYTWRLTMVLIHITVPIWCLYMAPYCPHYCTYMVLIHGALLSTLLYLYGAYTWRLIVHITVPIWCFKTPPDLCIFKNVRAKRIHSHPRLLLSHHHAFRKQLIQTAQAWCTHAVRCPHFTHSLSSLLSKNRTHNVLSFSLYSFSLII